MGSEFTFNMKLPNQSPHLAVLGFFIIGACFAAYVPVADADFIWDDDDYVLNNPTLWMEDGLRAIWLDPSATPQYYPMVHTTFWIEHAMWGLDPRGYHLVNVSLHAACAVLLLAILKHMGFRGAFLAALLFAIHPVMTESVAWVTERKNVLSLFFYLLSLAAMFEFTRTFRQHTVPSHLAYAMGFLFFVCAVLSKSVTCSLPAAVALAVWWKHGRLDRRTILSLVPFFIIGAAAASGTIWLEKHHVGAKGDLWNHALWDRIMIASRAPWFYLGKLLWPGSLSFVYPRWMVGAWRGWEVLFIPATIALLAAGLLRARSRMNCWGRAPLALLLFFGGTLFPALGFIDVFPFQYSFVADHFQYHASLGIIVGIAWLLSYMDARMPHRQLSRAVITICAISIMALTQSQTRIYQNQEFLWKDTLKKNPTALIAHNNLGAFYGSRGRLGEAAECYEKGLELDPDDDHLRVNLAAAYVEIGRSEEAMALVKELVERGSNNPWLWNTVGRAFQKSGRNVEALDAYQRAITHRPVLGDAWVNLAALLRSMGRHEQAHAKLREGLTASPKDAAILQALQTYSPPQDGNHSQERRQ